MGGLGRSNRRDLVTAGAGSCLFISARRARNSVNEIFRSLLILDRHAVRRIGGGIAEVPPSTRRQMPDLHVSTPVILCCPWGRRHAYNGAVQDAHSDAVVASASHGVQHRKQPLCAVMPGPAPLSICSFGLHLRHRSEPRLRRLDQRHSLNRQRPISYQANGIVTQSRLLERRLAYQRSRTRHSEEHPGAVMRESYNPGKEDFTVNDVPSELMLLVNTQAKGRIYPAV